MKKTTLNKKNKKETFSIHLKHIISKKAVFFTLDSIFAIILILIFIPLVIINIKPISNPTQSTNNLIEDYADYMLKENIFQDILNNNSKSKSLIQNKPKNLCLDIEIKNKSFDAEYYSEVTCAGRQNKQSTWRSFIYNENIYLGKLTTCAKNQCCKSSDCPNEESCLSGVCEDNINLNLPLNMNISDKSYFNSKTSCTNCPTWNETTKSYDFDGNNDYIEINNISLENYDNSDIFSIVFWVKPEDIDGGTIIGNFDGGIETINIEIDNRDIPGENSFRVFLRGDSGGYKEYVLARDYKIDTWYNLGFTWNSSELKLYDGGIFYESTKDKDDELSGTFDSGTNFQVGSDARSGGNYFKGSIDNIVIYNKTLSDLEIREIYEAGRT